MTMETLLSYGPLALTVAGLFGWQFFRKPPLTSAGFSTPANLVELLDKVDDLSLALMRDPGAAHLADSTKTALLEAVSAKTVVRKEVSGAAR